MTATAKYAALCFGVIAVAAVLLNQLYDGEEARRAILVSAAIGLLVQVGAFALLRSTKGAAQINAWVMGVLFRFVVVAVYGLVVLRAANLAVAPALVSLVSFLVICTLLEPLLLDR